MKILTLSTYPVKVPEHGGQHRVHNIVDAFKKAGHTVQSCGVLGSPNYPQEEGFVPFPGVDILRRYLPEPAVMEDWAISQLFRNDENFFKKLSDLIDGIPDVIHCEQPWLFGFALKYIQKKPKKNIKIIYGSANVECDLKFGIVKSWMGLDKAELYRPLVLDCEKEAILSSDLVVCVSEYDAKWVEQFNPSCEIVVAANGVVDRLVVLEDILCANRMTGGRKFALFCASAHLPNIEGFFDIFGDGAGCFPPNSHLVVAGSAGHGIFHNPQFVSCAGLSRPYMDAGIVSESLLTGLIKTAHTIILPITQGGGTNLKTAEALWSGKHVVATSKAMRGFEKFIGSPGVSVVDQPSLFLKEVCKSMLDRPHSIGIEERVRRREVLWDLTLEPLTKSVGKLGG